MPCNRMLLACGAALAATTLALPTVAAMNLKADVVKIDDWTYDVLYDRGFSAEEFLDTEVVGRRGQRIGEVEDLVVHPRGRITHAIVETGGFLDIGDRHLKIPLDGAAVTGNGKLMLNFDADAVGEYSLFKNVEDEDLPGRHWRISELIGDYAYLRDETRYGWVEDVIIGSDGQVEAVVVDPDVSYGQRGPYALPYYGYGYRYGFDPGHDRYNSPYTADELERLEPFERGRLAGEFDAVIVR